MKIKMPKNHASNKQLETIIQRIKARNQAYAIDTGNDLLQAKGLLKHGEFGPWLQVNFDWSFSTAQNYMNAAKLVHKNPTVANLKPSAVMTLAAPGTPEIVKAEVLADLDVGKVPTPQEIKTKIAAAKPKADAKDEFDLVEHLRTIGFLPSLEAMAAAFPHIDISAEGKEAA